MTDEDIFQLAEKNGYLDDFGRWNFTDDGLLDFAFEIQKAEREACAEVCDGFNDGFSLTANELAAAIRARGEK